MTRFLIILLFILKIIYNQIWLFTSQELSDICFFLMRKTQIFFFYKIWPNPPIHPSTAPIFKFEVSIESYNFIKKHFFLIAPRCLERWLRTSNLEEGYLVSNQSLFYEEQKSKRGFVKSDEHPLQVQWHKNRN